MFLKKSVLKKSTPALCALILSSALFSIPLIAESAPKNAPDNQIYKLTIKSDSNWTKIEIRDDAVWTIPEDETTTEIESKKGIKVLSLSSKSLYLKPQSRGELTVDVFIKSPNNILGLSICKGSASSYTLVQSDQGTQKNDINERDHCEKAALVLNLH